MNLKPIFNKPIDRHIEGVIKADDDASLRLEIEEYVLTNEVEKRLESFFDAYNNYAGANGVWVSGFFGSGKSHLLKMLALLLENRQIDGVPTLELFIPKCGENEILRGDLRRATAIPSKSILFNIDQKADVISKTQIDALLAVFVKVFDETCGYYGKQGHIARFERDLDSRGLYEKFQSSYESLARRTWQTGREQALLEAKNIAKAYAEVTDGDESSAMGILDKYRSEYRVSIEDFAEQVRAYLEQHAPDFRLNFFVDEVGQYIAENIKLMTNLQTIAESLATKCRGRAWIIVTSQNDMTTVIGEMNKQQSNDFSKIMARFDNKMLLTSTNVAEVIQKRLLSKTETGVETVSDLYHQNANNFGTLFSFSDGSREYKTYRDRDEFIRSYPFVPYQFELFQSAIENLSRHNAFEGKHSSVGERSMLGVFQQVAIQIGEHQLGQLATFDLMYEGIHTALKAQTQKAVLAAERQLTNDFAIRLLKALFLVKYVKEFKPTIHNLCVLMLDGFDQNLPVLKKQVEEALSLLEQQTYVQRNGDLYEYLTDEEKDVEQEIKNTEVESSDVAAELEKIVFDHVIKQRKIRYDASPSGGQGQDYTYSRKLDERLYGREYELAVHVISPFHEHADNAQMIRTSSTYNTDQLFIRMPPDDRLVRDLLMYKKTEKYIRQNISTAQQESVKRILSDKGFQNRERSSDLQQQIQSLIAKAQMMVGGADIETSSQDAQTRVVRGFHELISRAYPNLRMLRGINYTEDMIKTILESKDGTLFGSDATTLSEAEQEVLAFIQSNSRGGVRTTIKNLLERFERKPYGWYYAAVLCVLASLCARGKIEVRSDSNILEDNELDKALRNTHGHGNVILEPQVEFTASQVRTLKEFFADFFDTPAKANEGKALGYETTDNLQRLINQLTSLLAQSPQYPFLNALSGVIAKLEDLHRKPYTWYLTELASEEDELLSLKENVIDPINKFMSGSKKDIFDAISRFIHEQKPNFAYLNESDTYSLVACLNDPQCFKGNQMQEAKLQLDRLSQQINELINVEISSANAAIESLKQRLCAMPEFSTLTSDQQAEVTEPFVTSIDSIRNQQLIAVIRESLNRFRDIEYQRLLAQVANWQKGKSGDPNVTTDPEPVEHVTIRALPVSFSKVWLEDEEDIEAYLNALRQILQQAISNGKRVNL